MDILVLNAGSSSLKYQLLDVKSLKLHAIGICEKVGHEDAFHSFGLPGNEQVEHHHIRDHDDALGLVLDSLISGPTKALDSLSEIEGVGHRVVQGGKFFPESVYITNEVIDKIEELAVLAPLHNPPALRGIRACLHHMPDTPMVAVFDTSYFQTLEPKSYLYPLPYELYEEHDIRKYGAHGTSHRYVAERASELLGRPHDQTKIITLHLGNGCSATATKYGKAVDTSMGLTPLDGLMMGTRCGAIDPAIVPFVMDLKGLSTDEINTLMNKKSGLLGVSGVSNDLRNVFQAGEAGNERAHLAVEMYAQSIKKYIGMYAAVLNGVDAIVFTAGIGENSWIMRDKIIADLEGLGLLIEKERNVNGVGERVISSDDSRVTLMVIPTNEEYMIARDTHEILLARQEEGSC